jgi:hypothetical protein
MPLLKKPPCPKCGQQLPIDELWELHDFNQFRGYWLPTPLGVVCPGCGISLRLLQWPWYLLSFVVTAVFLIILHVLLPDAVLHVSTLQDFNTHDTIAWLLVFLLSIGIFLCYVKYGPYLFRVRPTRPSDSEIEYPLSQDNWKGDFDE